MRYSKWFVLALLVFVSAFLFGTVTTRGDAAKSGISGDINVTLTINENSKLTGDVTCSQVTGPCISFGESGIKLDLNGFTMTGSANVPPRANCVTASGFGAEGGDADGIQSKWDDVVIEGPGLVQGMRRHGIALLGTSTDPVDKSVVKNLVSHQNCFSGVFMGFVNNTLVEGIVSARNSANSEGRPCGGVCVTNSNNNRVRRSEFAGNGTKASGVGPTPPAPNDFGVGLVGSSTGNMIEENGIGGNINGLALFPLSPTATPTGNLIRRNTIVGNPPMEVSAANYPAINPVGADIRDFSAAGSNTFEDNLCITYTGLSPSPCTNLPRFAGHRNNHGGGGGGD